MGRDAHKKKGRWRDRKHGRALGKRPLDDGKYHAYRHDEHDIPDEKEEAVQLTPEAQQFLGSGGFQTDTNVMHLQTAKAIRSKLAQGYEKEIDSGNFHEYYCCTEDHDKRAAAMIWLGHAGSYGDSWKTLALFYGTYDKDQVVREEAFKAINAGNAAPINWLFAIRAEEALENPDESPIIKKEASAYLERIDAIVAEAHFTLKQGEMEVANGERKKLSNVAVDAKSTIRELEEKVQKNWELAQKNNWTALDIEKNNPSIFKCRTQYRRDEGPVEIRLPTIASQGKQANKLIG